MVNHSEQLDDVFSALSDATRRAMVGMLIERESLRISDLAEPFAMSMAAVSKHVDVLERAGMACRARRGREVHVSFDPGPLTQARDWLSVQEQYWTAALANLDKLIKDDLS